MGEGDWFVAAMLGAKHVEAAEVIKFDQSGQLDTEATNALLRDKCGDDHRLVLGGFYGSMPNGQIKTLTRGGSDETAGHVAAALKAEACEIWTDVSGIMVADPRVVDNPRRIATISPTEVYELAYRGAKVLHPGAIAPCETLRIPIWVMNTNHPEEGGTVIGHIGNGHNTITGIAGEKPFTTFILKKIGMNEEKGFGAKALAVFQKFDVSYDQNPSGLDKMSIVVNSKALNGNTDRIEEELRRVCDAKITVLRDHMALITVVSRDLENSQIPLTVFGAFAMNKIPTLMISMSCREEEDREDRKDREGNSLILGVRIKDYERAMRAIYDSFFPEQPKK